MKGIKNGRCTSTGVRWEGGEKKKEWGEGRTNKKGKKKQKKKKKIVNSKQKEHI